MKMNDIIRPTLVLDKEICLHNIEWMAAKAKQHNMRFRPHFKTHHSAEIGDWFRLFGVEAITVSSVRMAEYFISNGWKDVTIALSLNIHEIDVLNRLSESAKINILIENKEAATALVKKAKGQLGVYFKIDTGYNRTGIPSSRTGTIDNILSKNNNSLYRSFKIIPDNSALADTAKQDFEGFTFVAESTMGGA